MSTLLIVDKDVTQQELRLNLIDEDENRSEDRLRFGIEMTTANVSDLKECDALFLDMVQLRQQQIPEVEIFKHLVDKCFTIELTGESEQFLKVLSLVQKHLSSYELESLFHYIYDTNRMYWTCLDILHQEGRFTIYLKEFQGLLSGYQYLRKLTPDENSGLLEHEIIKDVHQNVLGEKRGYSSKERLVEFKGQIYKYCPPNEIERKMSRLIDRFNCEWWKIKNQQGSNALFKTLSNFVMDFLDIYPFGDGNGRVMRLLVIYVLESFGYKNPLLRFSADYNQWCQKALCFRYRHTMI